MLDLINNGAAVSKTFSLGDLLLNLGGVLIFTFIVKAHYQKYFPPLSKTQSMEKTLIVIGVVTFLVISVVKSSLALSLGLVGALSIIRFRTPIKEPFELSYLFLVIGIGLGFGADQRITTSTVVLILLFILYFLMKNKNQHDTDVHYIYVTIPKSVEAQELQNTFATLEKTSNNTIILRRFDQTESYTKLTMCVVLSDYKQLVEIKDHINDAFEPTELSIVDGQKLMPF